MPVTVGVLEVLNIVSSHRKRRKLWLSTGDSKFSIQKFLMKLCKQDGSVATVNGLDYRLVIISESIKNDVGEIFGVKVTSEKSKSIGFSFDQLHVGVNVFVAFDTQLELLFELLDVAPSLFTIRSRESFPGLKSGLGSGDEWLK